MIEQWEKELQLLLSEFDEQVGFKPNQVLVIGCSTSEIIGEKIGTAGTEEAAAFVFRQLKELQAKTKVQLAFQCCEHLNRALVVERETAEKLQLEEVTVIPVRKAGGAMATYAYHQFTDPVVVEFIKADAGIDIGSTLIGMHIKHVAVPVRVSRKTVGQAYVTLAKSRPKLIGGSRAVYEQNHENESC
ncbi:TIGR01440 family protein [Mesobacillus maritimus]|uniref:TIGR01440 family protein n=1 Tax=Mesobacillus maritimus TaxID=1643336 RepID=UPI0020408F68|nr:TIGR01440 family protein [Mesobacillus maritimus]MCM3668776.1 TIGR01440 family protein [Mesobacillus maritimus]